MCVNGLSAGKEKTTKTQQNQRTISTIIVTITIPGFIGNKTLQIKYKFNQLQIKLFFTKLLECIDGLDNGRYSVDMYAEHNATDFRHCCHHNHYHLRICVE